MRTQPSTVLPVVAADTRRRASSIAYGARAFEMRRDTAKSPAETKKDHEQEISVAAGMKVGLYGQHRWCPLQVQHFLSHTQATVRQAQAWGLWAYVELAQQVSEVRDGDQRWCRLCRARAGRPGRSHRQSQFYSPSCERDLELVSELEEILGKCRRGCQGECRPASVNSVSEAGTGERAAA